MIRCRKLVLGLGSQPSLPAAATAAPPYIHSADYLRNKAQLQQRDSITIVGSGQARPRSSRLLRDSAGHDYSLAWITRSPRFPDGEHQAHAGTDLARLHRVFLRSARSAPPPDPGAAEQPAQGINASLINQIYDLLDEKIHDGDRRYTLLTNSELRAAATTARKRAIT